MQTFEACKHAEEIQRMVNIVFPRGGEANKRHIGMNKMAATLVTNIDMGWPKRPNKYPDQQDVFKMKERLKKLWELIK